MRNRTGTLLAGVILMGSLFSVSSIVHAQNQAEQNPMMQKGMPNGQMRDHHGPGHKGNPVRHRVIRFKGGVPAPYTNLKNPLPAGENHVETGKKLYGEHCASCHGMDGKGDGKAGSGLQPKPANLAFIINRWIATDGFLMWSMAEGGEPLETAMPAFKEVLSKTDLWQIIHFLREDIGFGG